MRWASNRWFDGAYPVLPPLLAVLGSAWYGGFGPAIVATLVGPLIVILLPQRPGVPENIPLATILVYWSFCVGIASLGGLAARARERIFQHLDELARQREQLSATLRSIGDAVIVTDASGRINSLNPVAESLTAWTDETARGLPLIDVFRIVNEETGATVENPVERVLREGQIVGLANHTLLIAHDGTERPIDDSAAPIHDASGQLAGVVLVFRDVTERRNNERQLLQEARRKDEFLALLAHELRNPLAPIASALEILKLVDTDAESCQQARDVAERQLRHLTRLVDDLLDVSRIMRGKVELRRERVVLAAAIARAVETTQPMLSAKEHTISIDLPSQPIYLKADLVRLAQILGNLLSNAAKYTEPGGQISLSASMEGDMAVVCVKDTGIGIAPGDMARLFEMFMQVAPGASRSQGGLGIGLALVKNLVEMHGGSVVAHSAGIGQGCEFVVQLPLMAAADEPMAEPAASAPSLQLRSILVVDDNVDAAHSLAMLLRLRGHQVQVAVSGQEALSQVRETMPELIFLDIGMPGMDGYEVARRLRADYGSALEIVALTGWGTAQDRQRSSEAGFDKHLTKPVDLAQLEQVLSGSRRAAMAESQEPFDVAVPS